VDSNSAIFLLKNRFSYLAPIEAISPDLEKQGSLTVVFINREYSG